MLSRRNTIILIGVLALGLGAGGLYLWQRQQAAQAAALADIQKARVGRGAIFAAVSASGPLAAEAQVNLLFGATAPAPVAEVAVALGEAVKSGQVLARLDTADLELAVQQAQQAARSAELALALLQAPPRPEDVALAEANLRVAKAQVFQASQGNTPEQVEAARLSLVVAQRNLDQLNKQMQDYVDKGQYAKKQALEDQQKQLIQAAQVAELRYQQAQTPPSPGRAGSALAAVDQAQVALDKLKRGPTPEDLQIAQLQLKQAQAGLEQARNNLAHAQLVAPFDGVVAAVNIRQGEIAGGGLPAIVLADTRQYHIDVAVDEVDVARVAAGQPVTVTLDALPNQAFVGVVDRIAPQSTVTAGVVSYPVRVVVRNPEARLRVGMTATAEIVVQTAQDVVLAPNWAIRRDRNSGQAFVSVLRNGAVTEIPVTLGLRNETFSQIVTGLAEGDTVATQAGPQQFSLFGGGQ